MTSDRFRLLGRAVRGVALFGVWAVFSAAALAQNPVPFVNQPLVPDATAPGGPEFTLTVNGTGFVSGAVVDWNGSPLVTQFVSGSRLTATVPAANIATAGTASVTVVNPARGGGNSNVGFFQVVRPTPPLAFSLGPSIPPGSGAPFAAADFNQDGKLDLVANGPSGQTVSILLGDGRGDFSLASSPVVGWYPNAVAVGDFNGDGKLDLAVASCGSDQSCYSGGTVSILFGDGTGNFATGPSWAGAAAISIAVGDLNGDGNLDLIIPIVADGAEVLLGDGTGQFTFASYVPSGWLPIAAGVGDFNGDGILDLVVINEGSNTVSVSVGDGKGNFTLVSSPPVSGPPYLLAVADFNRDGKLDLAVGDNQDGAVDILLGDGTGNFISGSSFAVGSYPQSIAVGDFDGDGNLDLAIANGSAISIFLGNGDGTFVPDVFPVTPHAEGLVVGDFNGDGRLDLALNNGYIFLQPATVLASPSSLSFGTQLVGTSSAPQSVTLTNVGTGSVEIFDISVTGNFAQTNTCGEALAAGSECLITVTFMPVAPGISTGTLTVANDAAGTPEIVSVGGTGVISGTDAVLSAASLTFPNQLVHSSSPSQTLTLTNAGSTTLNITSIVATGDFAQTNTCPDSLSSGASCTIGVTFAPTHAGPRNGTIVISDNAPGSPQVVTLSGVGGGVEGRNPVPFLDQPPVPDATSPGGPDFTFTVNGSGFAAGAAVNWNGSPLATQFVSASQLTATVPAAYIATPTTALVTVVNPAPGGGTSSFQFFHVATPTPNISFVSSQITTGAPCAAIAADFNGDGKLDLAVGFCASQTYGNASLSVFLGNGDGTFQMPAYYTFDLGFTASPGGFAVGDFNGDGRLDLTVAGGWGSGVWVLLGNGDGSFQTPVLYGDTTISNIVAADFNGDGKLDLAVSTYPGLEVFLGNGDGTFQAPVINASAGSSSIDVGDFNGDGILDVLFTSSGSYYGAENVNLLAGNGDGTFQAPATVITVTTNEGEVSPLTFQLGVADWNGDGRLDLASAENTEHYGYQDGCGGCPGGPATVAYFSLGQGNGTFVGGGNNEVDSGGGASWASFLAGDLNADGKLDVIAESGYQGNGGPSSLSAPTFLLGNGDGTFATAPADTGGTGTILTTGDFNGDGRLDLVTVSLNSQGTDQGVSLLLNVGSATLALSSTSLSFGEQVVGTTSPAQQVTLTNAGQSTLVISSAAFTGDYALQNWTPCWGNETLVPGASCTITVAFTPTQAGTRTGTLTITDNAAGSPQTVTLTGIGEAPAPSAILSPTSLNFANQALHTASSPQTITLTNAGGGALNITSVVTSGDFAATNTCGATVAAGASCTMAVTFTPTVSGARTGAISIADNAPGSPQVVSLTGTGTAPSVTLSASTMLVGDQAVKTTSTAHTLTLTNSGNGALAITSIAASGDFAETNTCGKSVAAGASCTISVTFVPTAAGTRAGTITITDNAPGSPHIITLTGTGMGPAVSFSASAMSVGGAIVGTTSGAHIVTLTNSGNSALTISGMTISPSSFSETNTCGSSLAAGASCAVTVTFTPATAGTISGMLSITDNAPGSPHEVALSGMGQDFTIGPYDLSQTIPAGVTAPYDLKVAPAGGFNQTVSLACSGAPAQSTCSVTPASTSLDGLSPAVITLRVATQRAASTPPISRGPIGPPIRGPFGLPLPLAHGWPIAPMLSGLLLGATLLVMLGLGRMGGESRSEAGSSARLHLRVLTSAAVLMLLTLGWIACGGGSAFVYTPPSGGTPSGNYVITVTATSGPLSHAVTVKLTVE